MSREVTVFLSESASVRIRLTPNMQSKISMVTYILCYVRMCYCVNLLVEVSSDWRGSIGAAQHSGMR